MLQALIIAVLAQSPLYVRQDGGYVGRSLDGIDCRAPGLSCTICGSRVCLATAASGGTTAPTAAKYVVAEAHSDLSAEVAPGADDQVPVSDSSSAATWRTLPNCTDTSGQHLNYTTSSNTFSCGTSTPAVTEKSFMWARRTAAVACNAGACDALDHIDFNQVVESRGTNITLDTTTTYTVNNNVASSGRFTLKGGGKYLLQAFIPDVVFSTANASLVFGWTNADNGFIFQPVGVTPPFTAGSNLYWNGNVTVIVAPSVDTRYEVRFTAMTAATSMGETGTQPDGGVINSFPSCTIVEL